MLSFILYTKSQFMSDDEVCSPTRAALTSNHPCSFTASQRGLSHTILIEACAEGSQGGGEEKKNAKKADTMDRVYALTNVETFQRHNASYALRFPTK